MLREAEQAILNAMALAFRGLEEHGIRLSELERAERKRERQARAAQERQQQRAEKLYPTAIEYVVAQQQASVSMLQRHFKVGYSLARRLIDMMEHRGVIGPREGSKPRKVLIGSEEAIDEKSKRQRMVSAQPQNDAPSLLPQSLEELDVGQDWLVPLRTYVAASKQAGDILPHLLLVGPLGVGKTTVAHVIAKEMGSNLYSASGRALEKATEFVGILTNLDRGDILLIDELHRMPYEAVEYLLHAMNDFRVDIVIDRGPYAKAITVDLHLFSVIGEEETTRKLEPKLLAAFHNTIEIKWTAKELERILAFRCTRGQLKAEPEALHIIADAADGTIADAVKMLREAAMYARVVSKGQITVELAREALVASGTDIGPQASRPSAAMLPGEGLEQAVGKALEQRGFQVQNVRRSKDGGVDVLAVSDDPITGGRYVVQCKDWTHNVGVDTVRQLLGTVVRENAVQGVLVTTSSFTRQARTEAKGQRVRLIDGRELRQLLKAQEGRTGAERES